MPYQLLGLLSALAMFTASIPLLSIAVRVQQRNLRLLSTLLGLFALTHGIYHSTFLIGLAELGEILIGPLSAFMLAVFAVYYLKRGGSV